MLEQYKGKYVTAESARNYIDIDAIIEKCKTISSVGDEFSDIGRKVASVGSDCDANALSIDGETLNNFISGKSEGINNVSPYISNFADDIVSKAINAFNDIQKKLNEEAEAKEKEYEEKISRGEQVEFN